MHSLSRASRACRRPFSSAAAHPGKACRSRHCLHVRADAARNALVVGGGFAGLAAAQVLAEAGLDVTLVEQGRGLGGRVCTRTAELGPGEGRLTFDHGCQYLTAKSPQFGAVLESLRGEGVVARWGEGGTVGAATLLPDGSLEAGSFVAEDPDKALWVGVPTNSAVGRALAARCGPRLRTVRGSQVEALVWDEQRRAWAVRLGGSSGGEEQEAAAANLHAASFDVAITAMSSAATGRLLTRSSVGSLSSSSSSSPSSPSSSGGAGGAAADNGDGGAVGGGGDAGGGATPLAPQVVAAAAEVRANACWVLMVAFNRRIDLPFDGALLTLRPNATGGGQRYGAIAWVARDSSKPGRPAVAGGAGETWVVHAGPGWSNEWVEESPQAVAEELLAEFAQLAQVELSASDVVHLEAHRWDNAYPLNPRPPQQPQQQVVVGGLPVEGHFMLEPELMLGVCGDWCKGPRVSDAYVSGWEAAHALVRLGSVA